MIARIKFRYDLLIKRFGYLRTQRMVDFTRDGQLESTNLRGRHAGDGGF